MSYSTTALTAAFVLPSDILDEVYGAAAVAEVNRHARLAHPPLSADELLGADHPWTCEVDVLFTSWRAPVLNESMLARFPRLRAVFYAAGSVRHFVTPAFWQRGITLSSAAAANAVPVAEYTIAAIFMGLKRVWATARRTRETKSFDRGTIVADGAYQSRVGLVSLGAIGRLVVDRLRPFEVEIAAYDPFVSAADAAALGIRSLSLEELFATSSVVSLHAPRLPETLGLINGRLLASMRPGATFINTSRGALVKEGELCAVLGARPDLQAVLDVTDPEPPLADSPLYTLPNVVLTPHIAGSLGPERRRLGALMIAEFHRFRIGKPLQHGVTEVRAMHMA